MIVLFAFLHHAAFTLVAAVALEFALLRGDLTLWSARRLQVADMILGIKRVRTIVHLELAAMAVVLLCAALTTNGWSV